MALIYLRDPMLWLRDAGCHPNAHKTKPAQNHSTDDVGPHQPDGERLVPSRPGDIHIIVVVVAEEAFGSVELLVRWLLLLRLLRRAERAKSFVSFFCDLSRP